MRTLRHPMTVFTLMVLMVIGIGVGVVAATTSQKVYGPSWGRFTAAFPGHVYVYRGHTTVTTNYGNGSCTTESRCVSSAFGSSVTLTSPFEYSTASTPPILCISGMPCHLNELIVSVLRVVPAMPTKVVRQWVVSSAKSFLRTSAIEYEGNANSFVVATIGPRCAHGQCRGAEVVSNGRVIWSVVAFSNGPVSAVERFLNSFQPIG